jgi:methenyltetrahydrofolate cyclohydrolase
VRLVERTVEVFLGELAAESPAPGGGSAAALAGAMAASLCCMACRLTLARKRFEPAWPVMRKELEMAESIGARLRALIDEDSAAYNGVVAARRLPRGSDPERQARGRAVQEAAICAARIPLETLEAVAGLAEVLGRVVAGANPACITDAGSAAAMIRAAALSAAYNVRVNLPDIADGALMAGLSAAATAALAAVEENVTAIERAVQTELGKRSENHE